MSVFDIAISGIAAAAARLNVSAQNIVNSQTDGPLQDAQASSAATPASDPATPKVYAPLQLVQFSVPMSQGGGVGTTTRTNPNPSLAGYDPSAPYANAQGLVATPNVDLVTEAVSQIEALTQFKASLKVFKAGDDMMRAALSLTV
jgi:flagellar basal-body rod protein FlgC